MTAHDSNILRFIGGADKKFIIPVYQRPYSWKKESCVQLLKDLKDVYVEDYESHFFGSVVFVSQNNGVCEEYIVIDGQQRITTISLLLLALRNYVVDHPELKINVDPDKIKNVYLTDQYSNNKKKLKLKLVQGDDMAYDNLVEDKYPIENNRITANYNYFYNEISKMSKSDIEGLNTAITKLVIVCISLQPQNGDDPQLIFESLNSTGEALEAVDKIRNLVLMRMKSDEQERFYKKYWEPLEDTVTRDEMNTFIRYYLAVKKRKLPDEKKLYFEFKNYKENSRKSLETIISDMLEFANYYNCIRNPKKQNHIYSDVLFRISKLEMKTCIPLLLDLFKANADGYISEEEMSQLFEIIENYIVRREICELPTNALSRVFVQLGDEIDRDIEDNGMSYYEAFKYEILKKSSRSRYPNNHEFEDKFMVYDLYNTKSSMKKYILERLENYGNKERIAVEEQIDSKELTIEHVMPQTLTDDWKEKLGDKWELIHSKYKDTIGNLTLTAYNSDYSNSPFRVKKTMPDKGFDYSKLYLNDYIKKCELWGEEQIVNRAKILFNKAIKIWWIPETSISAVNSEEWVEWDEDVDFTNKKIVQVTIMDSVIKTSDVTSAYKVIHEALYDMEPTIYHNGNFTWFSEAESDFKESYKIGDKAYINTKKNSQNKILTIKTLAELCKFAPQDIRFLIEENTSNLKFAIDDESTYSFLTVGKLAYSFFEKLIELNAISEEEIEKLKTKEYTKRLFSQTDYPIIADSRDANKGNSKHIRYRKRPLTFKGKEIFITTQWFEGNRNDLIVWYKNHIQ